MSESHLSVEELYARPTRAKRERPWSIFSGAVIIISSIVFWVCIVYVPVGLLWTWPFVYVILLVVLLLILRRLERLYWAQPWAWKKG